MKQFLLVYRRSTGQLLRIEELGEKHLLAMTRRIENESIHKDDPDVEVVLLGSSSLEALKRTHARYFKSVRDLAADLVNALPAAS